MRAEMIQDVFASRSGYLDQIGDRYYSPYGEEIISKEVRVMIVKESRRVSNIVKSGLPCYDDGHHSKYDYGLPISILEEHHLILHYKQILTLDETTLNNYLAPLIRIYRGIA